VIVFVRAEQGRAGQGRTVQDPSVTYLGVSDAADRAVPYSDPASRIQVPPNQGIRPNQSLEEVTRKVITREGSQETGRADCQEETRRNETKQRVDNEKNE